MNGRSLQFIEAPFVDFPLVAFVARRKVSFFRSEFHGRPFVRRNAVDVFEVHDLFSVAVMAGRLHLLDRIGELHEARRALEQAGFEIGPKPVAKNGDSPIEGDAAEFLDHFRGKELGLVD